MSKQILFVINTLGLAGAETAMLELLDAMPEDCEIDLYVLMGQGELVGRLPERVRLLNRKFSSCSVLSAKGRLRMGGTVCRSLLARGTVVRLFPYLVKNLAGMVKNHRIQPDKLLWRVLSDGGMRIDREYDLAVAFLEGGAAYYVADHVKAKKKAAFIHIDYGKAGYTRALDRDCYPGYDALFPVSEETKESFLRVYPECREKTHTFHNMINREKIRKRSAEEGGFSDDYSGKRILTVGRLTKQKAYPVAIQAMRLLRDSGVEARWYVLGEGSERRTLEHLIAECGLEKDFVLVGAVDNPFPYYRQTDLYVHATGYEGKSIAIQEAQVLGCAIIASDCSGNREQITDGVDGELCELSAEDICRRVRDLLADDGRRAGLGRAAEQRKVMFEEDIQMLAALL